MAKKILVTGGAGFIGSHIADACLERGDNVHSVDDMSFGKKENLNPKVKNFKVDIADFNKLEKVFKETAPEIIFHCAALARIQPSFQNPSRYFQVNALGTYNILSLAKKYGTKKVIYSASSSAYGNQTFPSLKLRRINPPSLSEDMKITSQALHPYGSTKRMGEMISRDLSWDGGLQTICLRYFNVYGPRQTTTIDGPYATVIGIFLDQLKKGLPLTIVPDGFQRRDFTWVHDVVAANLLAGSSNIGQGEIINIGSAKNHSVWEAAKLILGVSKTASPKKLLAQDKCVMASARLGEVKTTLANISKAKKLLGWEPKMSFEKGIEILKG